jgi:hypothetical protein
VSLNRLRGAKAPCDPATTHVNVDAVIKNCIVLVVTNIFKPMQALAGDLEYNTMRHLCNRMYAYKNTQLHCTVSPVPIAILLVVLMIEMTMTVHPNATTAMAMYVFELFFDNLI